VRHSRSSCSRRLATLVGQRRLPADATFFCCGQCPLDLRQLSQGVVQFAVTLLVDTVSGQGLAGGGVCVGVVTQRVNLRLDFTALRQQLLGEVLRGQRCLDAFQGQAFVPQRIGGVLRRFNGRFEPGCAVAQGFQAAQLDFQPLEFGLARLALFFDLLTAGFLCQVLIATAFSLGDDFRQHRRFVLLIERLTAQRAGCFGSF
jgi:hypothetical protein